MAFSAKTFRMSLLVFLKSENPPYKVLSPSPSLITRTLNSPPQKPTNKPLSLLFQEAVGLIEKSGANESQSKSQGETNELKWRLTELEREVRKLKENPKGIKNEGVESEKPKKVKSLVGLFGGEKKQEKAVKIKRERGEGRVLKDLSRFAEIFVRNLYAKGYFNEANFLADKKLDFGYFDNSYGRDFIKSAAYKFGKDHQDIAKWLPGIHLKRVVLFGCASFEKNNVFAAKRLRSFFKIQENTVCSQCMLKNSCKFANMNVWGTGTKSLLLVDVMKVITLYALDEVHPKLTVPKDVNDSANQLLMKVIKLTETT
ncbi:hypothetical protein PTKIN_Ptkin19aG0014500 [Pterospermum kingtungense]